MSEIIETATDNIDQLLIELEAKRKELVASIYKIYIVVISVYVLLIVLSNYIGGKYNSFNSFITFGLVCFLLACGKASKYSYSSDFKPKIITTILKEYGNYTYKKNGGFTKVNEVKNARVIGEFNHFNASDCISGKFNDIEFSFCEANANMCKKRGFEFENKSEVKDVFNGLIYVLTFPDSLAGRVIVKRDKGVLMNWINEKELNLNKVNLESTEFENDFEILANDQVEARFVLSPVVMENILKMKNSFYDKDFVVSFFKNTVVISVSTSGDYFELNSPFESLLNKNGVNLFKEQFDQIFTFIKGINYRA